MPARIHDGLYPQSVLKDKKESIKLLKKYNEILHDRVPMHKKFKNISSDLSDLDREPPKHRRTISPWINLAPINSDRHRIVMPDKKNYVIPSELNPLTIDNYVPTEPIQNRDLMTSISVDNTPL